MIWPYRTRYGVPLHSSPPPPTGSKSYAKAVRATAPPAIPQPSSSAGEDSSTAGQLLCILPGVAEIYSVREKRPFEEVLNSLLRANGLCQFVIPVDLAEAYARAVQAVAPEPEPEEGTVAEPGPEDPDPAAPASDLSPPPSPKKKRKRNKKKDPGPQAEEQEQSSPDTQRQKVEHPSTSDRGEWKLSIPTDKDGYLLMAPFHESDDEEEQENIGDYMRRMENLKKNREKNKNLT